MLLCGLQAGDSPTTDIANQVTAAASAASAKGQAAISSASAVIQGAASATSAKLQAAAQPIADAMSSLQPPSISEQPNTHSQTSTAESEGHGAASGAASGPAPDHAKQALLQRIAMVKDSYRGDDCSCFDTTLGCLLKVYDQAYQLAKAECSLSDLPLIHHCTCSRHNCFLRCLQSNQSINPWCFMGALSLTPENNCVSDVSLASLLRLIIA